MLAGAESQAWCQLTSVTVGRPMRGRLCSVQTGHTLVGPTFRAIGLRRGFHSVGSDPPLHYNTAWLNGIEECLSRVHRSCVLRFQGGWKGVFLLFLPVRRGSRPRHLKRYIDFKLLECFLCVYWVGNKNTNFTGASPLYPLHNFTAIRDKACFKAIL